MPSPIRRTPALRALLGAVLATVLGVAVLAAPAQAGNRVTPGNFTGYGFDQCVTQTSATMDRWMAESPFSAVGIYISGDSRACRKQTNLTPAWVSHQLSAGWRLLPITLGPQASCLGRFPRYKDDESIKPDPKNNYGPARRQGRQEAAKAVEAARSLGIVAKSTLWYDLEGFDSGKQHCRESAIRFLGAWTNKLHALDYVSGVYSSASSGIKMLDQVRLNRPSLITLPDRLWIARWDGVANLDACHNQTQCWIRPEGWQPHKRVKQYRGGHNETWGGVTINIDSNYLSLGKGTRSKSRSTHCRSVNIDLARYPKITARNKPADAIRAAQCLLRKKGAYSGPLDGLRTQATLQGFHTWQQRMGQPTRDKWTPVNWTQLLSSGKQGVAKHGTQRPHVRRIHRALNAATRSSLVATGAFLGNTERAVKAWQDRVGLPRTGVMNERSWELLKQGRRR